MIGRKHFAAIVERALQAGNGAVLKAHKDCTCATCARVFLLREVGELRAAVVELALARKLHEEAKSDPTRNVATGLALYQAERAFAAWAAALEALPELSAQEEDRER